MLYKNEILYSFLLRYHRNSGNISFHQSLSEILEADTHIYSLDYFGNLGKILDRFGIAYDDFILNNTIYPYYHFFLSPSQYEIMLKNMLYTNKTYHKAVISPINNFLNPNKLYYCPMCIKEGNYNIVFKTYDQIDIVKVCEKHKCNLNEYEKTNRRTYNIIKPIMLDLKEHVVSENVFYLQNTIRRNVIDIMKLPYSFTVLELEARIKNALKEKKYMRNNRCFSYINIEIRNMLKDYRFLYPDVISSFDIEKIIGHGKAKKVSPLEYILICIYLFGGINETFNQK